MGILQIDVRNGAGRAVIEINRRRREQIKSSYIYIWYLIED